MRVSELAYESYNSKRLCWQQKSSIPNLVEIKILGNILLILYFLGPPLRKKDIYHLHSITHYF